MKVLHPFSGKRLEETLSVFIKACPRAYWEYENHKCKSELWQLHISLHWRLNRKAGLWTEWRPAARTARPRTNASNSVSQNHTNKVCLWASCITMKDPIICLCRSLSCTFHCIQCHTKIPWTTISDCIFWVFFFLNIESDLNFMQVEKRMFIVKHPQFSDSQSF